MATWRSRDDMFAERAPDLAECWDCAQRRLDEHEAEQRAAREMTRGEVAC